MRRLWQAMLVVIVALIVAAAVAIAQTNSYTLTKSVLSNGGGTISGGAYSLVGTIGQPIVGELRAGDYVIQSGFHGGGANASRVYLPITHR